MRRRIIFPDEFAGRRNFKIVREIEDEPTFDVDSADDTDDTDDVDYSYEPYQEEVITTDCTNYARARPDVDLSSLVLEEIARGATELIGVFGNNYRNEIQSVRRLGEDYAVLEPIRLDMFDADMDIEFMIYSVLLEFVLLRKPEGNRKREYISEFERLADTSREFTREGYGVYSNYEMLLRADKKLHLPQQTIVLFHKIMKEFHKKLIIVIDFGFNEIRGEVLQKLDGLKTYDVIFIVGGARSSDLIISGFNNTEREIGSGRTFSYFFRSNNIIVAD